MFTLGLTALFLSSCNEKKAEVKKAPKVEAVAKVTKTDKPAVKAPKPAVKVHKGEAVYKKTCFACHDNAVLGAPKLDDKANWAPRIAKGMEVLYSNAINGYQGVQGNMPAKGGNAPLSDDEVKQAVDYMVSFSQN